MFKHDRIKIRNCEKNVPSRLSKNDFIKTVALGHLMQGYTLLVPMIQRVLNRPRREDDKTSHK